MATHSSILAWEIPWTEEPGGLQSMGWERDMIEGLSTHVQACARACVCAHTHTHTDGHMPSRLLGSPLQLYPLFLPFAFSASALEIFELAISAAESEKELLGKFLLALRLQMMFVL